MKVFCGSSAVCNGVIMADKEFILKQRNKSGLDFQIKLVDGRELQIINKSKKINQAYSIDILSLADKSEKIFFIAWKWLIASLSFFLIMLLLLKILPGFLDANKNIYLGSVLLLGVVGSIFCFMKFLKNTSRKQVFYSRNALVPIVTLSLGNPSKKEFSNFIDAIENRIKKFRSHMDVSNEKQLTGEMKMLRRLCDDGIINKNVYEGAKEKLFSGFSSNSITHNRDS